VKPPKWSDWETALRQVTNLALVNYCKHELAAGRESYLRRRVLRYRVDGKRRWWLAARQKIGYVWQNGRFIDDQTFWQQRVDAKAEVKPVKDGTCLRFVLSSAQDFERFQKAVSSELLRVDFVENGSAEAPEEGVEE